MTKHTLADVIDYALNLLQHPSRWCQGDYAVTDDGTPCQPAAPDARRWCLLGALERGGYAYGHSIDQLHALARRTAAQPRPDNTITTWNDQPGRTHTEVLDLLRQMRDSLVTQQ